MENLKKITIATGIFTPEIGGPATYVETIAPGLMEFGFDVKVIARSKKSKYPEDKSLPYSVFRIKNSFLKPLTYFKFFLKIFGLARKDDLIFAQSPVSAGYPAYIANKFLKKKFVVKIVGDYAWEQYSLKNPFVDIMDFQNKKVSGKIKNLREIQKKVANAADVIIVPSNFLAKIVGRWGIKPEKIKVIYNSVDLKPLDIPKEEARKKIGISGNIILSIGRLVPWKGFKMLLKIMPELLKINPFFRLVIVGDGPEMKNLEKIKHNLGLEDKVFLVGKKSKEELKIYLKAADMFILNSGYEGFSHQILEAMSMEIPVLASVIGGNKEVIQSGENGLLFPYNDEFYIKQFIKVVHKDNDVRERLIEGGLKTAKLFTPEKMIKETANILSNI